MRRLLALTVIAALGAGCSGEENLTSTNPSESAVIGAGAAGPTEAVLIALRSAASADYEAAAVVTVLDQMPIVAALEGVPVGEAADLDAAGRVAVATRFWEGFASGIDWPDDPARITAGTLRELPVRNTFTQVSVRVPGIEPSPMVVEGDDGWWVDVFASFGPALIGEVVQITRSLTGDPSEEASRFVEILQAQRPSLLALRSRDDLTPEVVAAVDELLALLD